MACITVAVPDGKWDVIGRIAALEGMVVAAWIEDFLAQQVRIMLETARQELELEEGQLQAYLGTLDASDIKRY